MRGKGGEKGGYYDDSARLGPSSLLMGTHFDDSLQCRLITAVSSY